MSLFQAMAAVGCMTGIIEGALRASHHSLSSADVSPHVLEGVMLEAEDHWISGYRGALNGTANATEAMDDIRTSCVKVAIAMVESVKGHKNGLQKRMKGVCKLQQSDNLCGKFSTGLLATISDNSTMNIDGEIEGLLGSFCTHFMEASVRPKAEARNIAQKELEGKVHDRKARIAATMKVVAKAQEEVKAAQKAQLEALKKLPKLSPNQAKAAKKLAKPPTPAEVEALKRSQVHAKQEAAEQQGGAKGLEKELASEEKAENGVKGQVVDDALAVEANKDEPLPERKL